MFRLLKELLTGTEADLKDFSQTVKAYAPKTSQVKSSTTTLPYCKEQQAKKQRQKTIIIVQVLETAKICGRQ